MNAAQTRSPWQSATSTQRQLDLAFFLGVPLVLSLTMAMVGRQIDILGLTGGTLYIAALSFVPWWLAGLATSAASIALRRVAAPLWIVAALGVVLSLPFVMAYVHEVNVWFQTRWAGGHALPPLTWPDSFDRLREVALSAGRAIVLWTAFVLVFTYTLGWSRYLPARAGRTSDDTEDYAARRTRLLNSGQEWSREDEQRLAALVADGVPLKTIATDMKRTTSAIKTRMKKLGLSSPLR